MGSFDGGISDESNCLYRLSALELIIWARTIGYFEIETSEK